MPLSPADVHNVGFSKAPIGRRGYDPDDVDAFLEELERELARLIETNRELRVAAESPEEPSTTDDPRAAVEHARLRARAAQLREETAAAQRRANRLRELLRSRTESDEHQALEVLVLAEHTAHDHVADARREADHLLANSRAKADDVTDNARATAKSLERDTRARYHEALGPLEEQVSALQSRIERLKTFERENHVRLSAYVQSKLRELEAPEDEASEGEAPVEPAATRRPARRRRQAS